MLFLNQYIEEFRKEGNKQLAEELLQTKNVYNVLAGCDPIEAFDELIERYNWLGKKENKEKYSISQNLARNLPGSLLQDYLLNFAIKICEKFQRLDIFSEVSVTFGHYHLWEKGDVSVKSPSERTDIAIGYIEEEDKIKEPEVGWPRLPILKLNKNQRVLPLVTINSKIRVSQSEFFDWLGRDQLITKGNPHCLSVQVALRKEMDLSIVEASQAHSKFFLLGTGGETTVSPQLKELMRLKKTIEMHLSNHMK